MSQLIFEKAKEKILLVAHRGSFMGNIPCNVIPAYRAALLAGADMIEIDVEMCADGTLFIFHPGMEKPSLSFDGSITSLTAPQVRELRYLNFDRTPTQFGLNTLDEVFEEFGGKCLINVDKFWGHPKEIYEAIKRHGIEDSVIVKSAPNEKVFTVLRELCPNLPFMPIVKNTHPLHEQLMKSGIGYIGAEVLFTSDDDEVASPEFIDKMHRDDKLVWVNSIIYNYRDQLSAGHSDDTAICEDPELGWGWLARRGFDIIQTDWMSLINKYLDENGLLWRS